MMQPPLGSTISDSAFCADTSYPKYNNNHSGGKEPGSVDTYAGEDFSRLSRALVGFKKPGAPAVS